MKIVSWNISCIKKKNAFEYALSNIPADVYFFQECHHPLTYLTKADFTNIKENFIWEPTANGWGNCIVSKRNKLEQIEIKTDFKGRVVVGKLKTNCMELALINIHVPITDGRSRYNLKSIFEEIGHLIETSDSIIAGDLNFGKYFDKKGNTDHQDYLQILLDKYNLISCFHKFNIIEKQTFRHVKKPADCMLDYAFITKGIEDRLINCDVIINESIIESSDHNPLIIDLNLS